ncbi:MAG: ABC transporter permease [Clostridia bacterium]|nr:ABC transporter permease [Clostridia bacterium]
MFLHQFKYSFKTLMKKRMLIFWTFAFPIILGSFFKVAFGNIESDEKLKVIDIAIVENQGLEENSFYRESFESLSNEKDDDRMFNTKFTTEEDAKKMLENDEITGYLIIEENEPKAVIVSSGINETVFKYVVEEISQTANIVGNLVEREIMNNGTQNYAGEMPVINQEEIIKRAMKDSDINLKDVSKANLSYTMVEFYSLIAMACLYGAMLSMSCINQNLANMCSKGKRVAIAPVSKLKIIMSSVLASFLAQLIGIFILFLYTIYVLNVDYGSNLGLVVAQAIVGSFAGLSLGTFAACVLKKSEESKTGIIITFTMVGSYLAGMMGINTKYNIDVNAPFLNKINPVAMITDGLYSLYYYDTLDRFISDIVGLLVFSGILLMISYISLRRQKYDSI